MKTMEMIYNFILLSWCFTFSGSEVYALHYDYSYTSKCLSNPLRPQYGGGIVVNSELNDGLKGWSTFGSAKIEEKVSRNDNKFIVASQRRNSRDSFSQRFYLEEEKLYTFSAWLQVSHGVADIAAMFKTTSGYDQPIGWVIARAGCWSMLKGGLVVNVSGPAELYFESKNSLVDIWADNISLKPFTQRQWESHQDYSVKKFRKGKVRLRAIDHHGKPLANTTISILQKNSLFPFGNAINSHILTNKPYANWFTSRFKYTTFENEMKWYSTETSPGKEDYSIPDAMLRLVKGYEISVRGHNVFWDNPIFQPSWLKSLSSSNDQLSSACEERLNSVMKRYKKQLIHWDVVNENLHFSFFEKSLGKNASAIFYKMSNEVDESVIPFLNEYNTLEEMSDGDSTPAKYLEKIEELRGFGYGGPLGIGLQGHFGTPNLAYMRSAIDVLASTGLPIWITELDVSASPNQAMYLEQVIREVHAHPAINGIIMWASWRPEGCYRMCLTDNNFNNLPTGDVVDKILNEWKHKGLVGRTNNDGYFEANLFHGDYVVELNSSVVESFKVTPSRIVQKIIMHIDVSS